MRAPVHLALSLAVGSALACGPTPTRVCRHAMEVVGAEVPADEMRAITIESCVSRMQEERERMGLSVYRGQAKCVLASETSEALAACEPTIEGFPDRVTEPDS